jgi:hypothetical protein
MKRFGKHQILWSRYRTWGSAAQNAPHTPTRWQKRGLAAGTAQTNGDQTERPRFQFGSPVHPAPLGWDGWAAPLGWVGYHSHAIKIE